MKNEDISVSETRAALRVPLDAGIFERRAQDILGQIDRSRSEIGLKEAVDLVVERYVDDEPHPELRNFSDMLALARRHALMQHSLDDDREALHHGHLSHDGLVSTGHHYEMLRHEACQYNHLIRGIIESSCQYFTRDELMNWLTAASQGQAQWAKGEISGAVSEVALHAAMQGMPELRELRYATVEEDLVGYDFVASWQGQLLTVDAKTGFYAPLNERKHGHRHLEISVPHEAVDGFKVTRRGLDELRHDVRQALHSAVGVEVHGAHAPYRPVTQSN